MRIDLNNTVASQIANEQSAKVKNKAVSQHSGQVEDSATLSTDSVSISSLASQAMQSPEVRQEKVNALREAIGNGTYKVDAAKVADAIVRDHKK